MRFLFAITLMILVCWEHPGFGAEPHKEVTRKELIEWINNLDPETYVCDFSRLASYKRTLVTNEILTLLGKRCPTLKAINLTSCNSITYEGVASLANLCYPHLEQLNLSFSIHEYPWDSTIQSFKEMLSNCPNLKILDFNDLFLSDETLELISTFCPNLESVAFFAISTNQLKYSTFSQFTEQGLCDLVGSLPNLRQFSVSSNQMNQVSNRVLDIIAAHCPSITQIRVGSNLDLNDGIQVIAKNCPELIKIDYGNFSGETLRVVGQYSQNLECLELVKTHEYHDTNNFENEDAISVVVGCPNLKKFCAQFLTRTDLSDSFLQALSSKCHQLISLTIDNPLQDISSVITEKGLMHLVIGCPIIQTLNLSGSSGGITDKSLKVLSRLKELKFLNIAKSQVTADGVDKLLSDMPKLDMLDIVLCRKITKQQVETLRKKYPHVLIRR